jgi:mono/diheme cytochrome c family protein
VKKLLVGLGILVVLGLAGLGGFYLLATRYGALPPITPVDATTLDGDLVERGELLAAVGDCEVCHTRPGGEPYAGGLPLPTPFGIIYSTNITPDPETGIGAWSGEAFLRAMHQGIDRQGNHLYPAFPYDHFALVTEDDVAALYAYLMSQQAAQYTPPANEMPFPFSFRPVLEGWKILFHRPQVYTADASKDEEWNRGAYLVGGLAHCGACHTPRNAFGASDTSKFFGGATAEGWYVPAIGAASHSPIGWTQDAYLNYLFDGWDEHHGIAAGPMAPVIDSMAAADEDDIFAMATYLASLAEEPTDAAVDEAVIKIAALDWAEAERPGGANAPTDPALLHGEEVFFNQCVKCHKARMAKAQPASLGLTAAVNAPVPDNLLHVVVHGVQPARASSQRGMPAQGPAINDADMVALANFVRWRFTDLPAWTGVEEALARSRAH